MKLLRFETAAVALLCAACAACASAPMRYYTLVASPDGAAPPSAPPPSAPPVQFELARVGVPAQVDLPQLVVREGAQRVALLDGDRWAAPLGDEARAALAADLARDLPGQDVTGLAAGGKDVLRIKVDLRGFDSFPGSHVFVEAAWTVRGSHGGSKATTACTTSISEPVGPGLDALVVGHQRALARLAATIAAAAQAMASGGMGSCS
jgi:uncharacterized lipoprotein YmbA